MAWAREQPNPKPSWLVPWEELSEPEREVDRRIGEHFARPYVARDRWIVPVAYLDDFRALGFDLDNGSEGFVFVGAYADFALANSKVIAAKVEDEMLKEPERCDVHGQHGYCDLNKGHDPPDRHSRKGNEWNEGAPR